MSQEAVAAFYEQIQKDPSLQAALHDITDAQLPERLVAAGAEHGHEFSEADVREMMTPPQEEALSDEALEAVSGGAFDAFQPTSGFTNIGLNTQFCCTGKHIGIEDTSGTMAIRKSGGDAP